MALGADTVWMALGGRAVPTLRCVRCWFWFQNTKFYKIQNFEKRLAEKRLRNGWMIGSYQPLTVVNR
jgi:hypothetical protein